MLTESTHYGLLITVSEFPKEPSIHLSAALAQLSTDSKIVLNLVDLAPMGAHAKLCVRNLLELLVLNEYTNIYILYLNPTIKMQLSNLGARLHVHLRFMDAGNKPPMD